MQAKAGNGAPHLTEAYRFQLLVDAVTDYAIYMLDPRGVIISWNSGAERIKGYTAAEVIGQHFSLFFTPDDRKNGIPKRIIETARREGRHESESWRVRKDGSRFRAQATIQQIRDDQDELIGFAKITRDITERVAAHEALLESERRFRLLVEGVTDYAMYLLDPSGIITNWNSGAQRLKGYTADEIIGEHFSKFYTREDRVAGLPTRVLETATREGRYEAEGWRVRKDGSRFWASMAVNAIRSPKGDLVGFAKVTRDITERRAAQEALRESERQFRLLVAGVTDYALFMLDPNGIVTSWNVGAERIKGYRAAEIIGHHFSRFYPERDRAAGAPAKALHAATQEGRFESEGWRMRKDGTLFWANAVIDAVRDEHGRLIGFAKITRDITERRNAQLALEEAQVQRAHAQKMEALGKLTGGVAHDFNNLLMVVSGHVQTIKKQLGDNPKTARAAEAIEVAAKRGAALTRQLLTFSRRQAIQPIVVSVAERAESLRNMLASSFDGAIKLTTVVSPNVWPIRVDPNEFELALVNIILNARDSLPKAGGVITVTAENLVLAPADTEQALQGEFVAIRVNDTGSGIAPDVLPKVFDPFFTTKDASRGSGLGLSQVHGFVHQSGGTVTIGSELGKGTTVTLYFPRSREEVTPEAPSLEVTDVDGGRVLVVEDNPDVTDVTVSMLEQLGYAVDAVGDASAALDRIARHDYELVVADIVMPGEMDGVALAGKIRERKPDLPVLLVTGYSEALRHGTREFTVLRKPFELSELSRAAANLIASARQPDNGNLVRLKDARASREHKHDKK